MRGVNCRGAAKSGGWELLIGVFLFQKHLAQGGIAFVAAFCDPSLRKSAAHRAILGAFLHVSAIHVAAVPKVGGDLGEGGGKLLQGEEIKPFEIQ